MSLKGWHFLFVDVSSTRKSSLFRYVMSPESQNCVFGMFMMCSCIIHCKCWSHCNIFIQKYSAFNLHYKFPGNNSLFTFVIGVEILKASIYSYAFCLHSLKSFSISGIVVTLHF